MGFATRVSTEINISNHLHLVWNGLDQRNTRDNRLNTICMALPTTSEEKKLAT